MSGLLPREGCSVMMPCRNRLRFEEPSLTRSFWRPEAARRNRNVFMRSMRESFKPLRQQSWISQRPRERKRRRRRAAEGLWESSMSSWRLDRQPSIGNLPNWNLCGIWQSATTAMETASVRLWNVGNRRRESWG